MDQLKPVKPTSPLRYAVGMFGTSIPINMFKTFAAIFYVDRLSLIDSKQFSLILLLYTFLDAIDNPVYGFLSDRTRTKWGRRRPWFVIGAPLLVLCFVMFFNPPAALGPGSAFYYILLMYMLTGTLDSLINANYGALFPELFPTEKSRAKTNAMRQVFQFLAMIISIALTPVVAGVLGYSTTALVYGALAIAVIYFMTFGCHENPEYMDKPKPVLFGSIRDIVSNPKYWLYGLANAAFFAGLGLIQAGVPFYTKYVLKVGGTGQMIMLGTVIGSAILFIPLWVLIIRKLTLMPAWRLALILMAVFVAPLYFTGSLVLATVAVVLVGFALAGVSTTMDIVAARILDEDAQKHGVQREGMFSSLLGVLNKSSGLFSALAYVLVSQLYGYINGDNPGAAPDKAALFLTVLFPICVMILSIALSRFVKFENTAKE